MGKSRLPAWLSCVLDIVAEQGLSPFRSLSGQLDFVLRNIAADISKVVIPVIFL